MTKTAEQCRSCGTPNAENARFCSHCRFPLIVVAGKYILQKQLAAGGHGKVFLARHKGLAFDAERVLKIIQPEVIQIAGMSKRFIREVQLTAALSQKNEHIVRIFDDFGEEEGLGHYYVMEYLQGESLADFLEARGKLPLELALKIFHQASKGLLAAHERKIVHRDLKPDNIFLASVRQGELFVKIIDFGIAKSHEHTPLTLGVIGTPLYMAPEQCDSNGLVDPRTDLYALGLILYEMVSGRFPYSFDAPLSAMQLLHAHLTQEPIPLTQWLPEAAALSEILLDAMAKYPEQRPSSLTEMWERIREAHAELSLPPLSESVQIVDGARPPSADPPKSTKRLAYENTEELGSSKPLAGFSPESDEGSEATLSDTPPSDTPPSDTPPSEPLASEFPQSQLHDRDLPTSQPHGTKGAMVAASLFVLLGLGFLWHWRAPESPPAAAPGKTLAREPARGLRSPAPSRPEPVIPEARPSKARPPKTQRSRAPAVPGTRPAARPLRRRPKSRPPKRRALVAWRRKVARRTPRVHKRRPPHIGKPVSACGARPKGKRWVEATLHQPSRGQARVVYLACPSCQTRRRGSLYCLAIPETQTSVKLQISASGYEDCSHAIGPTHKRIGWVLRVTDPDSLAVARYNCLRIPK